MGYLKAIRRTGFQAGLGAALVIFAGMPAVAGQHVAASSLRQGLPGRRISGGTRSECMAGSAPVVALAPESNLGKTLSDSPSVYFVVPQLEKNYPLEFSLRDSAGNRIYETALNTRDDHGIVGIQLPSQSLEVNENYRWYLSVVCDAYDVSQNDVLSGWLRQVEPNDSLNVMQPAGIEESLALVNGYRDAELWTDAIDALVSLSEQHPADESIRSSWNQLLQALAIENVVDTSIAMR